MKLFFMAVCENCYFKAVCVWIERRDALKAQTNAFYYEFSLHIQTWYTHMPYMSITDNLHISSKVCAHMYCTVYSTMCFAHSVDWLPWLGVVGKVDVEKNGSHDKKHPIKPICFQLLVSKCVCELNEKQQRNLTIFFVRYSSP